MNQIRTIASSAVAGFVLQLVMLVVIMRFGLPKQLAHVLGFAILPGVALFWPQGFHSDSGFIGLGLAFLVNTIYYALIMLAGICIWHRRRVS